MKSFTKTFKSHESGSIMLEVVAVLALMGIMGAMLFRQIYQRNQELHNIQMASEIRTVKEAFSAYIQANRASILADCPLPSDNTQVLLCNQNSRNSTTNAFAVADYLPEQWFTGNELDGAYTFSIWNYKQADDTGRRIVYGIVIPTAGTLPSTGWNFRRAARVALLIGADGGAYSSTITTCDTDDDGNDDASCISGSLGSWQIPLTNQFIVPNDKNGNIMPFYAATTGVDIFAPEHDAPEGKVRIPDNWSLALQNLHAYQYFSVGNRGSGTCYENIMHGTYSGDPETLGSDTIKQGLTENCKPLFWVGTDAENILDLAEGNVYVATDLNIGAIENIEGTLKHNEALKLTSEGEIKQKDGLTVDKDGNIIDGGIIKQKDGLTIDKGRIITKETVSADIGDLKSGEHFVVDPAYTSTMGDIRLTSRGGVRLSDILPNYIVKESKQGYCELDVDGEGHSTLDAKSGTVNKKSWCDLNKTSYSGNLTTGAGYTNFEIKTPSCPKGYKYAVVVIPQYFGRQGKIITKKSHTHGNTGEAGTETHTHSTGTAVTSDPNNTDTQFVSDIEDCQFFVDARLWGDTTATPTAQPQEQPFGGASYNLQITLGYRKKGSSGERAPIYCANAGDGQKEYLHAIVQTYCVWDPSFLTTKASCNAAGYKWDNINSKCTTDPENDSTPNDNSAAGLERDCVDAGFTWGGRGDKNGNDITRDGYGNFRCLYKYNLTNINTHINDVTKKAAACKAAGWVWDPEANSGNGACSCPTGMHWSSSDLECQ